MRDINDIVARRVRKWKGKKRRFHKSINKKTKGPVIRERTKLQRIMGINSLILIEKIRER